jgi:hypothetical protein
MQFTTSASMGCVLSWTRDLLPVHLFGVLIFTPFSVLSSFCGFAFFPVFQLPLAAVIV